MKINAYLIDSFRFYKSYHRHSVNKFIHTCTIPIMVLTVFVLLSYVGYTYKVQSIPLFVSRLFAINIGLLVILTYLCIYSFLDVKGTLLIMPIIAIMYLVSNIIRYYLPYAWLVAIIVHVVTWILQFIGHGIFEKNRPALIDSAVQAFIMAPFFIFLELLFKCCNYNTELQDKINTF